MTDISLSSSQLCSLEYCYLRQIVMTTFPHLKLGSCWEEMKAMYEGLNFISRRNVLILMLMFYWKKLDEEQIFFWIYLFFSWVVYYVVTTLSAFLVNIFKCKSFNLTAVSDLFLFFFCNLTRRHRPVLEKCYDIDHVMKVGDYFQWR